MYKKNSPKFIEKRDKLEITLNLKSIIKTIITIIVLLVFVSSLGQIYIHLFSQGKYHNLIKLTSLEQEQSIPTVYAIFSLLLCSILLAIIAKTKYNHRNRYRHHWKVLSLIFLYLSIDEGASIHETSNRVMGNLFNAQGFWYFAWIIPAMILLSLFLLIYFKFILALPKHTRFLFVTAGIVFISGSLGMEMIGAKIFVAPNYGVNSSMYALVATIEETIEMSGIAIFIFALLKYTKRYVSCLKISVE